MATIINYLDQQRQDVSMPASNAHHEAWHAERKKVKTIYYQLTVVDEVLPINYGSKKLITEMHKGGELLGQWHDTSVLLHYIKQLVSWQKKERVNLPVNAHKLVLLIQTDEKEHLALATRQLRKLVINQEASPQ
jgi:CHAD domain-containing protein